MSWCDIPPRLDVKSARTVADIFPRPVGDRGCFGPVCRFVMRGCFGPLGLFRHFSFSCGLICLADSAKNEFDADAVGRNSPSLNIDIRGRSSPYYLRAEAAVCSACPTRLPIESPSPPPSPHARKPANSIASPDDIASHPHPHPIPSNPFQSLPVPSNLLRSPRLAARICSQPRGSRAPLEGSWANSWREQRRS